MTSAILNRPSRRLHGLLPAKREPIAVIGKPIRFRFVQNLAWGIGVGLLGVCLVAGLYFMILQARYGGVSLKHGWDHLFSSPSWTLYRHNAFRDLLEPALFVMAGKTLMAKSKYWDKPVGKIRLLITPLLVVILAIGLGLAGTWLLYFGLPHPWQQPQWQIIVLGAIIGLVLHRLWAPVGATLQGIPVDKSVDRARGIRQNGHNPDYAPLWVRKPLAPPVVRERWADLMSNETDTDVAPQPPRWFRWAIVLGVLLAVFLIVVGAVAKYYLARGGVVAVWPWNV